MVSVVIATRDRAASLRRVLDSLRLAAPPDDEWEMIVVDNGSTDHTRRTVDAFASAGAPTVRYVHEPRRGKSFAVNRGVAESRGDLLLFTDDDVLVDPDWCRALAAAMRGSNWLGAGGRIVAEWTAPPPAWLSGTGPDRLMTVVSFDMGDNPGELTAPPFGPNMAFRREAFDRYGLFRTDLGPGAGRYLPGQDTEFGRRLMQAGERLGWVPGAVVRHVHQPHKMSMRHVASWYFGYGRMAVRTGGVPPGAVRFRGVPGYLLRSLVTSLAAGTMSLEPYRRARHFADACRHAGAIVETVAAQTAGRA